MDFVLMTAFSVIGLATLLSFLPVYDIIHQDWYIQAHQFWIKYVLQTGLQMSSWLPVKAVATVADIFFFFFTALFTFNIVRLVLNIITGGGSRG